MAKDASLLVRIGANLDDLDKAIGQMGSRFDKIGANLRNVGTSLTKWVTAPMVAAGGLALKSSIDFESAFAGVRKTVNASEETFKQLEAGIRSMAREIPASAGAIAQVAEAAGQLGIETENILSFTRVMIDLGEATNLSADEAATALARLANITGMPQESFDRLGSSIVALGNNLATTEAEIVNMSLRLAGAGAQIGLTEAEILGFAAALSSVGIEAEAGGSAFSKVMIEMAQAARSGGEELDLFAQVAGVTAQQFREAFENDAAGAIQMFVAGLGRMSEEGENTFGVLEELGFAEVRVRDALLRTSGASDVLASSLKISREAWAANTALTNEAAQRYATTESVLRILWNRLAEVARTVGDALKPAFVSLLQSLEPVFQKVEQLAQSFADADPSIQKLVIGIGALAASIGPVVAGLGTLMGVASALKAGMAALGISMQAAFIGTGVGAAVVALGAAALVVYQNWDKVREFFDSRFPGALDKAKAVIDLLASGAKKIVDGLVSAVEATLDTIRSLVTTFEGVITGDWEKIFTGLLEISKDWIDANKKLFEDYFTSARDKWVNYGKDLAKGFDHGMREGAKKIREDPVEFFFGDLLRSHASIGKKLATFFTNVTRGAIAAASNVLDSQTKSLLAGTTKFTGALKDLDKRLSEAAQAAHEKAKADEKLRIEQERLLEVNEEITAAWDEYNEALRDAEIEHRVMRDDLAFLKSNISAAEGLMKSLIKLGVDPASEAFRQLEEDVRLAYFALYKMEEAAEKAKASLADIPKVKTRQEIEIEATGTDKVIDDIRGIGEAAKDAADDGVSALAKAFERVRDLASSMIDRIGDAMGRVLGDAISDAILGVHSLGDAFREIKEKGVEVLVRSVVGELTQAFSKWIADTIKKILMEKGLVWALNQVAAAGSAAARSLWGGSSSYSSGGFGFYFTLGGGSNMPGQFGMNNLPYGGAPAPYVPPGWIPQGPIGVDTSQYTSQYGGPAHNPTYNGPPVGGLIEEYHNIFAGVEQSFREISAQAEILGDAFDESGARISVMEGALIDLLTLGIDPMDPAFQKLFEQYQKEKGEREALAQQMEIDEIFSGIGTALANVDIGGSLEEQYDALNAKADILRQGIADLIAAGVDPASAQFRNLTINLQSTERQIENIAKQMKIESIFGDMAASMEDIENKALVLGDTFNAAGAKASLLENTMIELLNAGVDPASAEFKLLAMQLDLARVEAERFADEMRVQEIWDNLGESLEDVRAKAQVLGDEFNHFEAEARIMEQALIDLAREGKYATPEFMDLSRSLDETRRNAANLDEQMRRQDAWERLQQDLKQIDAQAFVLGDSFNATEAKARVVERAMIDLIANGIDPSSSAYRVLEEALRTGNFSADLFTDTIRKQTDAYSDLNYVASQVPGWIWAQNEAMMETYNRNIAPVPKALSELEAEYKALLDKAAGIRARLDDPSTSPQSARNLRINLQSVERLIESTFLQLEEAMRRQRGKPEEEAPKTPAVPEPIRDTIQNITNVANNFNTSRLESGMDRLVKAAEILTDVNARGFTTLGYIMKGGDVSFEAIKRLPDLLKAASFDVTKLNRVTIGEGVTQNIYVQLDGNEIARATFIGMPSVANVYGVS